MHAITLVCSIHNENGSCNVEQLVKILQAIGPDVIFQEVGPSHDWSMEARAIAEYRKIKPCMQIHVDQQKMPPDAVELKKLLDSGFEYATEISDEYRSLERKNDAHIRQDGFSYLNSADFEKTRLRMSEIEDELIGGKAGNALRWFRQFMQQRETEIMRNIYTHCRENIFETGVFLIGAGHKTGIAKQIEYFCGREPNLITWSFYDDQIHRE